MYDGLYEALKQAQEHEDAYSHLNPKLDKCRIHHDSNGNITIAQIGPPWLIECSDPYIETAASVMHELEWHKVKDGKLIAIDPHAADVVKLQKSDEGPLRVVRGISSLLLEPDEEWDQIERYKHR